MIFNTFYNSLKEESEKKVEEVDISESIDKLSPEKLNDTNTVLKLKKKKLNFINYKLDMVNQIKLYIEGLEWLNGSRGTLKQVKYYITHNCSYKETQEHFSIEYNALKVKILRASSSLEAKIGVNTLDNLITCNKKSELDEIIDSYEENIKRTVIKTSKLLVKEAGKLLPVAKLNAIDDISECLRELDFLKVYSKAVVEKRFNRLNKMNLATILFILDSDDVAYVDLKGLFNSYINAEISLKVLKDKYNEL